MTETPPRSRRFAAQNAAESLFAESLKAKKDEKEKRKEIERQKYSTAHLREEEKLLLRVRANRYKRSLASSPSANNLTKRKQRGAHIADIAGQPTQLGYHFTSSIPATYAKPDDEPACFICGATLPKGLNLGLGHHLHQVLCDKGKQIKNEDTTPEYNNIGNDGGGGDDEPEFEEYEWAGQTRVRVTSMLEGGFAAHGFNVYNKKRDKDVEEDIDIDLDEEEVFGGVQFTNDDVGKYVAVGGAFDDEEGVGTQEGNPETGSPVPYNGGDEDELVDVEDLDVSKELAKFMTTVPSDAKLVIEAVN
ncbi:hypothetical protein BDR26DRAFT_929136 [Obelidium mucronatum]|nr:hypothetical protein BDR26DRAFT_929136 [Obelidium mucronatum]